MVVKTKEVIKLFNVEMNNEEINSIFRLLRNAIEGSECCDSTTYDMYSYLKQLYEEEEL